MVYWGGVSNGGGDGDRSSEEMDHDGISPPREPPKSTSKSRATSPGGDKKLKLACAECRRSKLKCDRRVPCQACIRRGCATICPEGTLAATKGNKALQARNERLEEQARNLKDRIKELENELSESRRINQSNDSISVESPIEEPNPPPAQSPRLEAAIGSLAITEEGSAKYYGSTSSSEYLSALLPGHGPESALDRQRDPKHLDIPPEILQLIYAFPLGLKDCRYDSSIFQRYIPLRDVAQRYVALHYEYAAWQFNPFPSKEFYMEIFDYIYLPGVENPTLSTIHPHQLALFFSVLAHGAFYSRNSSTASIATQERYHALSCGALSLAPIARGVTCSTVQALFSIIRFLYYSVRSASEEHFLLFAVTVRAAQMMGIHCDGSAWTLEKAELQRRRTIFWDLYTYDAWGSFVQGRPPVIHLEYCDCKFPHSETSQPAELGWHEWKHQYTATFLPPTLKLAFNITKVPYEKLVELDRSIRGYPVPPQLQSPFLGTDNRPWSGHAPTALMQYNTIVMKEASIMYLHRSYAAIAIRSCPSDPLNHQFGGSVLAAYRSACRIWLSLKGVHVVHPDAVAHVWFFWSGVYSACMFFAALVLGSPGCSLSQEALLELNKAYEFYEKGSALLRPPNSMAILSQLKAQAHDTFAAYHRDPSATSQRPNDELSLVGGNHGLIRHISRSPPQSSSGRDISSPSMSPTSRSSEPIRTTLQMRTSSIRTAFTPEQTPEPETPSWYPTSRMHSSFETSSLRGGPSTSDVAGINGRRNSILSGSSGYMSFQPPISRQATLERPNQGTCSFHSGGFTSSPRQSEAYIAGDPTSTTPEFWNPGYQGVGECGGQNIWQTFMESLMNSSPAGNG